MQDAPVEWHAEHNAIMLTFNGEVYNYKELAKEWGVELTATTTDAHVILEGYKKEGPFFVQKLEGMYAIAIADNRNHKLFLFRDRLGEKPLYYMTKEGVTYFASEIKALPANQKSYLDSDFITFENPLGGNTLYQGVSLLEPGHWIEANILTGAMRDNEYWSLPNTSFDPCIGQKDLLKTFSDLLIHAAKSRTAGGVPMSNTDASLFCGD